jgi:hypothetical protein
MPIILKPSITAVIAFAATAFAVSASAVAAADTQLITSCPQPSESNGVILSDTVTDCSTPGNVQINAAPDMPDYPYPWDDEFYGSALLIGGYGRGYR